MTRFLELDLHAYGPFTGHTLDLSGGAEGLHVIYGANEAGKSSALRAIRALLYGIHAQTPDAFVHEYQKLRIGARIRHSDGSTLTFLRRKGNKNTLLDYDESPLDDGVLARFLGGVDADRFSLLFGIGHEELVRGGRRILEGGGDAGESLFAAALGGASLREVRDRLEGEANELFRPRGQKQLINRALIELETARREVRDASLSSEEWARHERDLGAAREERARLIDALRARRAEKNRLERLRRAQGGLARRRELRARRQELGAVLLLPDGFGGERRELERALEDARAGGERDRDELLRIAVQIEGLAVPEAVLAHGDSIDALFQRLGAMRAGRDERRQHEGGRQQLLADARALLAELRPGLALEDAAGLRPVAAYRTRLQELAGEHRALEDAVRKAGQDLAELEEGLAATGQELAALPPARDGRALRLAVDQARGEGDLEARLDKLRREVEAAEAQAHAALGRLGLWQGPLEALAALPVPARETVARFDDAWTEGERQQARVAERLAAAQDEVAALDRDLEALRLEGAVPTEDELAHVRELRDALWQHIRRRYIDGEGAARGDGGPGERARVRSHSVPADEGAARGGGEPEGGPAVGLDVGPAGAGPGEPPAGTFERRLREADVLADRLRHEAGRVARHADLTARRHERAEALAALATEQASLRQAAAAREAAWAAAWAPAGIRPLGPKEMQGWLMQHQALVQRVADARARRGEVEALEARVRTSIDALGRGLAAVEEPAAAAGASLAGALAATVRVLEAMDRAEARRRELGALRDREQGRLARVRQARAEAEARLSAWQGAWQEAVAHLGLDASATPAVAREVLARFEELFRKLDEAARLGRLLQALDEDLARFEAEVRALVERVAPEAGALPREQAVEQLHALLQKARRDEATRAALARQQQTRERSLADAEERVAHLQRRLAELCRQARCDAPAALAEVEARSDRARELDRDIARIEQQLVEQGEGWTLEELEREAAQVDGDALPARIAELDAEIHQLDERRSALGEVIGSKENELTRMDGVSRAAEAAELVESKVAELREAVERYMRLRLASEILRREIERYRERNQGPLLGRASELFAALTLGSFAALQTRFDERDEPVLVGMRPSGGAVPVDGMSDGTRDQLYLSLRLATLERFVAHNEPLPFVVDDILVHFDDQRAEATLRVLAELSRKTQILFFTHHRRLLELAEAAVEPATLQVHTLAPIRRST